MMYINKNKIEQMDCFKIQAETLHYLSEQKKNFANIIQVLSYISQIDDQILQFFPVNKQFQQVQEFIFDHVRGEKESQEEPQVSVEVLKFGEQGEQQKQFNPGGRSKIIEISSKNQIQQAFDEKKEKRMSGKSIRSKKFEKEKAFESDEKDKINEQNQSSKKKVSIKDKVNFIRTTCLFDLFWATLTQKCINKQQRYVQILDTAYAYFKINQMLNKNNNAYSADVQIKQRNKNELIQKQFEKFIQQNTGSCAYTNNLPILVKLCLRLKEINQYIKVNKDLITVRKMCVDMKNSILDELPKQLGKEAQRRQYIHAEKQKYEHSKTMRTTHLNNLTSQISINNSINPSQRDSIKKKKDQSIFQIQNLQKKINKILLQMDRQKLYFKFKNVKQIQTYYILFLWRLESSIVFINEILNKETTYKKQEFLKYLKMGKSIRDSNAYSVVSSNQDENQNKKEQSVNQINQNKKEQSAHQIAKQNTVMELKTGRIMPEIISFGQALRLIKNKLILQKLLFAYSSISKYSKKLKESKYYNMLVMELQITYRYLFKMNKKISHNCMKIINYFNSTIDFQHSLQVNIKDIFDYFNGKNQNQKKNSQNPSKNKTDSVDKKVEFIGIPDTLEQEKLTKRSKQKTSKKSLKSLHLIKQKKNFQSSSINYEQIYKQIQEEQLKNEKQQFKTYFKLDSHTKAEDNFLQLVNENNHRKNFAKSLDYITNRSSKTLHHKGKFYQKNSTHSPKCANEKSTINYHINLDEVIKDQLCEQNAEKMKTNKTNRRTFIRKGYNQQSFSGQLTSKNQNRSQIETYNKQTGQVFVLAKRPIKKCMSPNQNGANSENATPSTNNVKPSFQYIKMKKRLGTLDRRHSFKKQIINLISITKRNIKPGRYFNQIKDAENNRYRSIISTEQRVTVLNKERLLDQISHMHEVNYQKAHPTLSQILITPGSVTEKNSVNKGEHEDSYSIKGIASSTGLNISFQNNKFQLKMIQNFGMAIGFLNIKMLANSKASEYEVSYTCYRSKLENQYLTVSVNNKNFQFGNPQNKNPINKQDQITYKTSFSLQELKKQIINSEFYFELIQENLQKNIEGSDIYMIAQYFNYFEHSNPDQHLISILPNSNSSSIYKNNDQNKDKNTESLGLVLENSKLSMNLNWKTNEEKSLEVKEKANKIQSIIFAFTQRISHSLLYWYYTKGIKITGTILLKRQIPDISDPLKFTIALEFMKKYTHKQCLQKLSNVRNKKALYQCVRYLFFGRKIIVKDFLRKKNLIMFYTVSLQNFHDSQFRIKTIEQGGSEFKDLVFTITLYNKSAELLFQKYEYPVNQILSSKQITLLMLNNIIQQQINPKYIQKILIDIQAKESSTISKNIRQPYARQYDIIQQNCEQQNLESENLIKSKPHNESSLQKIIQQLNHKIRNFGNLILLYVDIIESSVDLAVINLFKKVIKVEKHYYLIQQIYLRCGLVMHVICRAQNKNQILHITIYQIKDLTSLIQKLKHQESKRVEKKKKQQRKKENQALMKIKSMMMDKRKVKKVIRTFSHQNYHNGRSNQKSRYTYSPEKIENQSNFSHKYLVPQIKGDLSKVSELVNAFEYQFEVISKNINESFLEYNPIYKNRKSAYHSRIVVSCPHNTKRNLINKINKCIIEKQEMDMIEMINSFYVHHQNKKSRKGSDQKYENKKVKRIIKLRNKYIYISILFNKLIQAYRVDLYDTSSSNRYSAYFRLQQYGISDQFIRNYLNYHNQIISTTEVLEEQGYNKTHRQNYDTYYNHNYFVKKEKIERDEPEKSAKILIQKKDNSIKRQIYQCNYLLSQFMPNNLDMDRSNSMIFSSTNTLDLRPDVQKKIDEPSDGQNQQINEKLKYKQNIDQISLANLFVLHLLNDNRFLISQDSKSLTFELGQMQNEMKQIQIPLYPTFNNVSSFEGRNLGKIQLIEINSKLYLLIIFQNQSHLYLSEVDDNPYMNNVNLFADFKAKEHLVNLYTDLFMRMYVKFVGSTMTGQFYPKIRDIGNTI